MLCLLADSINQFVGHIICFSLKTKAVVDYPGVDDTVFEETIRIYGKSKLIIGKCYQIDESSVPKY